MRTLFLVGGVISDNKFIEQSGIISYGRDVLHRDDAPVRVFGGIYDYGQLEEKNETIVYGGLITNHWGHFLVDFTTRLWYVLECDEEYRVAFVVRENQHLQLISNISRFLELLGISKERVLFINKPTQFSRVIVPECAYITNRYYSHKFLSVFDAVAEAALKSVSEITFEAEKVYFTRNGWHKAQSSEAGEEILVDLFKANGFRVISPEKCTLDQQIAIIRNSRIVAGIEGTIPHNMLFADNGQKLLIINKTYNVNSMQRDINIMRKLDVTFVDAYISVLPVPMGDGPFTLIYSEPLNRFLEEEAWKKPDSKYTRKEYQSKNIRRVIRIARRNIGTGKMNINYIADEGNSAYFDPQHLLMYYSKFYTEVERITLIEKMQAQIMHVYNFMRKVQYRLKDKLRK